jgi:hypothetical protein
LSLPKLFTLSVSPFLSINSWKKRPVLVSHSFILSFFLIGFSFFSILHSWVGSKFPLFLCFC